MEALNLKYKHAKLRDLELLKNQALPGPFTSSQKVLSYLSSDESEETKNERLYIEV